MSLQPVFIAGYSLGLKTNEKPFLIPDQAFTTLENAYVWRERVKKREGLQLLGRLRRILTGQNLGNTDGAGNFSGNIKAILTLQADAQIEIDSISVTVGAQVFTESANGVLTNGGAGTGTINYTTGALTINTDPNLAATAVTIDFNYFAGLPAMGIFQREIAAINDEQTIFFDRNYAYIHSGTGFQEFIAGTTWSGGDSDFFWCTNYRGVLPTDRLFFATNFVVNAANPMRYTDGTTWTTFNPIIADVPESAAQSLLYQARILIPYYGRLLALNTYEGTAAGGYASATNFFNRCRFSQIGSPVAADAWRSDQFGKGGFIDAPTNEAIISAAFIKNTLIVFFERTTWQLRYVGEYGLPFIWERVSSDFGSESTFSTVLFNEGVAAVGDRAIISADAVNVNRIDLDIPDLVFNFRNADNGLERVHGIRDYQRELVFWCYSDSEIAHKFPNRVLVYNYRNNTYATFRDNVTCFGTFQPDTAVTWDSQEVTWDDQDVTWDDPDSQSLFPRIVCGNQEGFIHYYGYTTPDESSLSIKSVNLILDPIRFTVINHNLEDGDIIYITGLNFVDGSGAPLSTNLNDIIYRVTVIDTDTLSLSRWITASQAYANLNYTNFSITPVNTATYIGGGLITLFPKLSVITKDFNPLQIQGKQVKISYIDFLTDCTESAAMTVILYVNAAQAIQGNLIVGNRTSETFATSPYYPGPTPAQPISEYLWHRFFATVAAQYIRIQMTYDDDLMNTLATQQQNWILDAMALYVRPGGKIVF